MCAPIAAIVPWLTGAAAVATVVSALKPAPSFDMPAAPAAPAAPKVETPAPAPTVQDVNPNVVKVSTAGQARQQMRRQLAAQQSWLSTKKTGALGLTDTAATKKSSLLGGMATPLGA